MLACAVSLVAAQAGQPETVVALIGARVYADPAAIPVDDAVVVMTGQRITAVGARKEVPVPPGATTIDATGLVVLAGFQNSHVHFTDDARWSEAASRPAAAIEASLREMVTRYGFTTIVDLASFPRQHQGAAPPCRLRARSPVRASSPPERRSIRQRASPTTCATPCRPTWSRPCPSRRRRPPPPS